MLTCKRCNGSIIQEVYKIDSIKRYWLFYQCQNCGDSRWSKVPCSKPNQRPSWAKIPHDAQFEKRQDELIQKKSEQDKKRRHEEWHASYLSHLNSDKWKKTRLKVINRCKNLCEGCGENRVEHVHHKTYDHLGYELLFELVGLCVSCHEKTHGRQFYKGEDFDSTRDMA